jgi:GTP cyclohydrolase I
MNLKEKLSQVEKIGQNHIGTSTDTPLREDAFDINDEQKIKTVQEHVEGIIHTLGIELSDDSLKGTPLRVAKMYVKEIFAGLNNKHKPKMFTFDNK